MTMRSALRTILLCVVGPLVGCAPRSSIHAVAPGAPSTTRSELAVTHGSAPEIVGTSPWGPTDEIGALNMMTAASRAAILARADGAKVYDLSTEYFVGMPGVDLFGDPPYQYWLTHTPRGTTVDDPVHVGRAHNEKVSYTGDAVSMYTHTGTHLDALNHFGLDGKIYNGGAADAQLGDRGWKRNGIEKVPPIVARGVLVDVAAAKGLAMLPERYAITVADLEAALTREKTRLEPGDVVLVRTGRMSAWPDRARFAGNEPGLSLAAARWLAEDRKAMIVGSDAISPEPLPSPREDNWLPVHTYLLAQRGVPILEVLDLEALSRDRIYEVAFVAMPLRLRGASAAPLRPIAFPLK